MREGRQAKRALEGLLAHLSPHAEQVDRWPDKDNRIEPEIDAVAGHYAIEHTCLQSFRGQSEDRSFFERLATLEQRIRLPYRLSVTFPVGALSRGSDWTSIVDAIERWIVTSSSTLLVAAIPFPWRACRSR